jgi:hypothetical protein
MSFCSSLQFFGHHNHWLMSLQGGLTVVTRRDVSNYLAVAMQGYAVKLSKLRENDCLVDAKREWYKN